MNVCGIWDPNRGADDCDILEYYAVSTGQGPAILSEDGGCTFSRNVGSYQSTRLNLLDDSLASLLSVY
jgi:hypothetical protein